MISYRMKFQTTFPNRCIFIYIAVVLNNLASKCLRLFSFVCGGLFSGGWRMWVGAGTNSQFANDLHVPFLPSMFLWTESAFIRSFIYAILHKLRMVRIYGIFIWSENVVSFNGTWSKATESYNYDDLLEAADCTGGVIWGFFECQYSSSKPQIVM